MCWNLFWKTAITNGRCWNSLRFEENVAITKRRCWYLYRKTSLKADREAWGGRGFSVSLRFNFAPMSLRFLFDFIMVSLFNCLVTPIPLRVLSISLRSHFEFTSIPLRFHFGLTSNSLRPHIDLTSVPHRFHADPTSVSLRFHFDLTSIPRRFHIDFTSISVRSHF